MILLAFLLNVAYATELTFVNNTGADARIAELKNKCIGSLVKEEAPVHLKPNQSYTFTTTPVVHIYKVCGSGTCSSSAIGMKNAEKYVASLIIKGGYIDTSLTPDHWVGNLECE